MVNSAGAKRALINRIIAAQLTPIQSGVIFQALWWLIVLSPISFDKLQGHFFQFSICILALYRIWLRSKKAPLKDFLIRVRPTLALMALDFVYWLSGAYQTPLGGFWLLSLWVAFIALALEPIEFALARLPTPWAIVLCAAAGPLSYAIGPKLGTLTIAGFSRFGPFAEYVHWLLMALSWAGFALFIKRTVGPTAKLLKDQ